MESTDNSNLTAGAISDTISEFLRSAKPKTHRTLFDLFLNGYLRIGCSIALFSLYPCQATFIVAFLFITGGMGVLVNLSHESQHSALLGDKRWNDLIGAWLCAYPLGSIYGSSRAVHMAHHKYLNTTADPDRHFHNEQDKSDPVQFASYLVKLVLGGQLWTSIIVNGFLREKNARAGTQAEPVVVLPRRSYPEILNLLPVQAVVFSVFWLATGYWWAYFALWLLPIFTLGTLFGYIRGFIDHARLASDDEGRSEGRLVSVPMPSLLDRIFFTGLEFHFHAEHHFFPSVPHYYLPDLHRLLQDDSAFNSRYLLRPSYTSFLRDYFKQISRGQKSRITERTYVGRAETDRSRKKPKVLLIMPKLPPSFWGMEYSAPFVGYRYPNPPLGIMTIAGAISPEYEVEIRDENIEDVKAPSDADIVGISGTLLHSFHVARVLDLAQHFRAQGKTICVGGPVANLSPDVVRPHFDVLFEGEGELTWRQFLQDFEKGEGKDLYQQSEMIDMAQAPTPRVDLIKAKHYGAAQIQTTRGCPFTCEFCDIIVMYGRKVRAKPVEAVLKEVQMWADAGQDIVFFSDDNFVGNRVYAKQLLKELIQFNSKRSYPIAFYTQASIDAARDPELLQLLAAANFHGMFIGIESPRKESLVETKKVQNAVTLDMAAAIHTIQSHGLWVSGGMIIGFDNDDAEIFEEQFNFIQSAGVVFCQLSLLEAMPKTPLWERIKKEGRLLPYKDGLCTNIAPRHMSYQELLNGYTALVRRLYTPEAYLERYLTTLSHMKGDLFNNDRHAFSFRKAAYVFKTIGYYTFTTDGARRSFFLRMLVNTMRMQPKAWKWMIRNLASFIHFQNFAERYTMVVLAPVTNASEKTKEAC